MNKYRITYPNNKEVREYKSRTTKTGDALTAMGIGALSGGIGAGVGSLVSLGLGTATTLTSAIGNGMIIGGSGGFAGGFVSGAGNAWANGATFLDGLTAGLISGGIGAASGAILGGISGGIQYQKQNLIFSKGLDKLGVESGDPVPATDGFLKQAQEAWFPDAPMKNINKFTVENVPENTFIGDNAKAAGATSALVGKTSGKISNFSNVYFNKLEAFNSAKRLFYTMGHEFVHVSQYAALAGQEVSIIRDAVFRDMLDFHAYSYEYNVLGSSNYGGFTTSDVVKFAETYPAFNSMHYDNFSWTKHFNKPF